MNRVDDQGGLAVLNRTDEVEVAVEADARKMAEERRIHRRLPSPALGWIDAARVKYGAPVTIVNLSMTGVLLESDKPLAPGSRQALEITGPGRSVIIPFGVVRSRISELAPRGAVYRIACAFTRPLELPELAAAGTSGSATRADIVPSAR